MSGPAIDPNDEAAVRAYAVDRLAKAIARQVVRADLGARLEAVGLLDDAIDAAVADAEAGRAIVLIAPPPRSAD